MRKKITTPPDTITSRIDGWIGTSGRMPASIAELISRDRAGARNLAIAVIRARMVARHKKVLGHD